MEAAAAAFVVLGVAAVKARVSAGVKARVASLVKRMFNCFLM